MAKRDKTPNPSHKVRVSQKLASDSKGDGATPDYEPNWDYWKCMPKLELYEAVALTCGIEPEAITPTGEFSEPDLGIFYQRLNIAERHFPVKQYPDGVPTGDFVEWAMNMANTAPPLWEGVHPRFRELASKKPPLADGLKTTPESTVQGTAPPDARRPPAEDDRQASASVDASKTTPENKAPGSAPPDPHPPTAEDNPMEAASADASTPSAEDKQPDTKERKTLLKIILVLLQEHKSIDINDPFVAAQKIVNLANKAKISLKPNTVYRHLKIAETLLPKDSPASPPEEQAPNVPTDKKD